LACAAQARDGESWIALSEADLDLTDHANTARALERLRPRMILNAAAYTNVDQAELEPAKALAVNADAVANLAIISRRLDCLLVHVSTDYVFNGRGGAPYAEDDPTDPINAYGRSKLVGEQAIHEIDPMHLIVRTAGLFAPHGRSFVRAIRDRLLAGDEPITVVADQRTRLTHADDLAGMIFALVDRGARGVVHATNDGQAAWIEVARHVAARLGMEDRIRPVTAAQLGRPAARPADSVLSLERLHAIGLRPRHWRAAVDDVLAAWGGDR